MEMNTKFNYYDILEVNPQSSQNEVTEAYSRARITYSGGNPALYTIFTQKEAREYLRLVEEAYSVLGNKSLRALYDQKLGRGVTGVDQVTYEQLLQESKITRPLDLPKLGRLKPEYEIDESFETRIRAETQFSGEFLRRVREYKHVTLEQLSAITKVSSFYIHAIEHMEAQNLPAPVFVRGYVIQICRVLGLDEKKGPDSYMKLFRETLAAASG
ncbi:MAG: hypothetical protein C5B49_05890 [Bdellovibrio sp.]|nr:MAG: hypothetical protein C5B49_05890 [Bdellovibrio sp.]